MSSSPNHFPAEDSKSAGATPPSGSESAGDSRGRLPGEEATWRREPKLRPRMLRKTQIGMAWLTLLLLAAVLVWVSTWLNPPRTTDVLLIGAGYEDDLAIPHNVYGWQSLVKLADVLRAPGRWRFWGSETLRLRHDPLRLRPGTDWQQWLKDADEKNVVLFLALHGGADEQGAYLLSENAGVKNTPANRLRLTAVLDALARLPRQRNKLLILDATQVEAHWPLGLLHNNFARELAALEDRILAIPNLVVISASAADQRSWVAIQWRQTIFAHSLIEGLLGAAQDDQNDGRIDAWELFRFARANTRQWVQANRGTIQTPILLPGGSEGISRAHRMVLAVARGDYRAADPHQTPVFVPPPELISAWKTHQRLASAVPSPPVYSPHVWRMYQQSLLRYEQLIRAGDRESAFSLASRLRELDLRITRSKTTELASLQDTLTMPAAAGIRLPQWDSDSAGGDDPAMKATSAAFQKLWNAPPASYANVWSRLQNSLGSSHRDRVRLRLGLMDLLLVRAAENDADQFDKACSLLRVLDDPLHPRPAEIHFALMLQRDLPCDTSSAEAGSLVQLALQVRRQAERTALAVQPDKYPYSEHVYRWTGGQVRQADHSRRMGEDLLLAGAAWWPRARKHLELAQSGYQQAAELAAQVSDAFATRDRVLAMLPFYTQWLARRAPAVRGAVPQGRELLEQVESLWQDTHQLVALLERAPETSTNSTGQSAQAIQATQATQATPISAGSTKPLSIRGLPEQTERVSNSFSWLEHLLLGWWQELSDTDLPEVWRDADDALVVPQHDPQLRMKLLLNERRTSRRLLIETAQSIGKQSSDSDVKITIDAAELARREAEAQESGRRQGRLALAVLGRRWFDQCPCQPQETFEQVRHRLDVLPVEQAWYKSLALAGHQIALRWSSMPGTINKLEQQSRKADAAGARQLLQRADCLSSQLDAASGAVVAGNAAEDYHRLLLQGLLLWQAERCLKDHWFSADPQAEPYFQVAGATYLNDAARLAPQDKAVRALEQQFKQAGRLVLAPSPALELTSQPTAEIQTRLEGTPKTKLPEGYATVWAEVAGSIQLLQPADGERQVRSLATKDGGVPLVCSLACPQLQQAERHPPAKPTVAVSTVTLHALFRGQRLSQSTPVRQHLLPMTTVSRQPRPARASVAIRASESLHQQYGSGSGTVAIVLDCSGSMGPLENQPFDRNTKYAEATGALRTVLSRLPEGTTVSVWVFGQAVGTDKTVEDVERTIRRVQEPVRWNPRQDASQLDKLMARLEYPALEPWNTSPIVEAMLAAKADLVSSSGFKTLLVLTDGMDNRFGRGAKSAGPQVDVPAALRQQFANTGITVNIVGFKVVDKEQSEAQRQFRVVERFFPPGGFYTVDESEKLVEVLDASLRQRMRYWIEDYDNRLVGSVPKAGLEISRADANSQWLPGGLPPGGYQLLAHAAGLVQAELSLNRGDLLSLQLAKTPTGLTFSRTVYSREDFSWKPSIEQSGWRLALLQNQLAGSQRVEMLLTLERLDESGETRLAQIRPRQVWLEVVPRAETPTLVACRWYAQPGYPAPAWTIDLPTWPRDPATTTLLPPRLRMWWNPDQAAPATLTLQRPGDFKSLAELRQRTVPLLGQQATLLDVSVEPHVVEIRPGVRDEQTCLVVRLRHGEGQPLWAEVDGFETAGTEHRFYQSIHQTTSLFWPVTEDQVHARLQRINLISLPRFKQHAQSRGYYAELKDLSPPDANDVRPPPVVVNPPKQ